jgi:hypothetical protein
VRRARAPRRVEAPLEEACSQAEPGSASCVQRFDDSLNSAIRTTYRISLRSSSLREPRYPSTRVVCLLVLEMLNEENDPLKAARFAQLQGHAVLPKGKLNARLARKDDTLKRAPPALQCLCARRPRPPSRRGERSKRYERRAKASTDPRRQRHRGDRPSRADPPGVQVTVRIRAGGKTGNDPSAGSPTETLLRLLLPLNDKVWTASRGIAAGEPAALPQSGGLTGSFNR